MRIIRYLVLLLCFTIVPLTQTQSNDSIIIPENIADIQPIMKIVFDEPHFWAYPSADGHYARIDREIWDLETGERIVELRGQFQLYYNDIIFSPDNRFFVTRQENVIQLRETLTGEIRLLSPYLDGSALSHSFSPDGRWLALNLFDYADSKFIIWNLETMQRDYTIPQPDVSVVLFHPTEPVLAVGTGTGQVIMWRFPEDGEPVASNTINIPDNEVHDIAFTRDGSYIMAKVARPGIFIGPTIIADYHTGELHFQTSSPYEDYLMGHYANTLLRLPGTRQQSGIYWDAVSLEVRSEITTAGQRFGANSLNPDETLLLTEDPDVEAEVIVWQVDSGEEVYRFTEQYSAWFTAYGERIITMNDYSLTVWALLEGE